MREDGGYGAVRILFQTSETHAERLGHRLYLEREHAQTVHHGTHTFGHHTQVFGAHQHLCGLQERRQLFHGLRSPEVIMPVVEVLLVQPVEGLPLLRGQLLVVGIVLHRDAGMIEALLAVVFHEELRMERHAVALDFLHRHGQRRHELSQQRRRTVDGHLPDAEEAQHVVYSVGVEVFGHLLEAPDPPAIARLMHGLPVVGGEAPVLTVFGEVVGRRAGRTLEVEQLGLRPGLHARA